MKRFCKSLCRVGVFAALVLSVTAADVEGVLMDKMCSMKEAKEGQKAAATHTRDCAMMPDCRQSGYGVFTADNRFLGFDDAGNTKAVEALKASKQKDNSR